jgi:uncharacterized membrane protein HdeD (DUF308 family)
MKSLFLANGIDNTAFGKNWLWFFLWGIALVILGIYAIGAATFTTSLTIVLLGFIIMLSGIVILLDGLSFWRKRNGFFFHLLMGVLYIGVGLMLIKSPLSGSMSITLLLGIFYLVLGLVRLYFSMSLRAPRWGWSFLNGLISALLGILILTSWPESSLYIIGLFVGIDLLFCGWTYIMASLVAKSIAAR